MRKVNYSNPKESQDSNLTNKLKMFTVNKIYFYKISKSPPLNFFFLLNKTN